MVILTVSVEGDELHVEVGQEASYNEVFRYTSAALGIMYQSYLDETGAELDFEEFISDVLIVARHSANATLAGDVAKTPKEGWS